MQILLCMAHELEIRLLKAEQDKKPGYVVKHILELVPAGNGLYSASVRSEELMKGQKPRLITGRLFIDAGIVSLDKDLKCIQ